jgi:autotransporter translocation and assembly factor TamB
VGFEPDTVRVRADFALDGVRADLKRGGGAAYGPLELALRGELAHAPASGRTIVHDGLLALAAIQLEVGGTIDKGTSNRATIGRGAIGGSAARADSVGPPQLDLALASGRFDPAKVLSLLGEAAPAGLKAQGDAQLSARLRGPANEPAVNGSLVLTGVEVTPPGRDRPLLTAMNGDIGFTRTTLEATGLRGEMSGNPFTLAARVRDFGKPVVSGSVKLDGARLADFAALITLPSGMAVDGGTVSADLNFATSAPDFAKALTLNGSARGHGITARTPGLKAPIRELEFVATLAGRQATIEPFRLTVGRSDLGGRLKLLSLDKPALELALTSRRLDLDELMGDEKDRAQAESRTTGGGAEGGRGAMVPAQGRVQVEELLVHGLVARPASLNLVVDERGSIRLDDVSASILGGSLNGDLAINLANPDSIRYRSTLKLSGMRANELLTATTPVKNLIDGQLDGDIDLSGIRAGDTPPLALMTALGNAQVSGGHLEVKGAIAAVLRQIGIIDSDRIDFQRLITKIQIERGRVRLDDLKFGSAKHGEFVVSGTAGLDGTLDYAVSTLLPKRYTPPELASRKEVMDLLADPSGRIPLEFKIQGTAKDPKVKLDLRAIEARIAGRAKDKVKDRAEEEAGKVVEEAKDRLREGLGDLLGGRRKKATPPDTARPRPAEPDTTRPDTARSGTRP